ncbi:MAG TPA: HAD family hydrolase [Patescibacteria group bacterium]|nr:HAD family hydrolase [Patescibacteria group bacterium]
MKYKALFIDVDDTLVIHGLEYLPSKRVSQAVAQCTKKGVAVCLATSRPLYAAINIIAHLNMKGLCILNGGTQIYDPINKRMVRELYIPKGAISKLLAYARKHHLKIGIFDGENNIDLPKHLISKETGRIIGFYLPEIALSRVDKVEKDLEDIMDVAIHKMLSWDKKYGWIDVTNGKATKLHGILEVAKRLSIEPHEMIGIGDGYNDFPLLMACGLKIAMGNAVPELKAIADFIAPSVEEDGVATVIEKFILS